VFWNILLAVTVTSLLNVVIGTHSGSGTRLGLSEDNLFRDLDRRALRPAAICGGCTSISRLSLCPKSRNIGNARLPRDPSDTKPWKLVYVNAGSISACRIESVRINRGGKRLVITGDGCVKAALDIGPEIALAAKFGSR
jgi:hypothetical protein